MGGPLQRRAHGLGHAHEAAVEQFQGDGVGRGQVRDDGGRRERLMRQPDQAVGLGPGAPARGKGDLGVAAHDQGGTLNRGADGVGGKDRGAPVLAAGGQGDGPGGGLRRRGDASL